eukprot:Platyproteum_vivax@DN2814_c0_g1_i1.p1
MSSLKFSPTAVAQKVCEFASRHPVECSSVTVRDPLGGAAEATRTCATTAERHPNLSTSESKEGRRPLVIAGPSGVGKGTLITQLRDRFPNTFGFSVSHTSREPRPGELHGVHYWFQDRHAILNDVKNGHFLEYAEVHGNLYGTSYESVEKVHEQGLICLLEIDLQGVQQVQASALGSHSVYVFIAPPNVEEVERRLRNRATETEDKIRKRVANARLEMQEADKLHFDKIVLNDKLSSAFDDLVVFLSGEYPLKHA